jgi:hypothetical protein
VIESWSRGEGEMGAALQALRGTQPQQAPTSGW